MIPTLGNPAGQQAVSGIFDKSPQQQPFPLFQFSTPARYHIENQEFAVGDLVWYEIKITSGLGGVQWGEAVIGEVLPDNRYRLAGKTWSYDHLTHPLIGEKGGPPGYSSVQDIHTGRQIYKQWAISHHPNSHVRRMALSGTDEVMHPALSSVPGTAMFKVWDREQIPHCPIPNMSTLTEFRGENYSLQDAQKKYGENLEFKGSKQNDFGPEFWGISMEQLIAIKDLPGYNEEMKMYNVVETLIKPLTKGKGMGYSLLINKEKPLRAKQMISHAWGEEYSKFVRAIQNSGCEGPFWVCAMAIYQEDEKTISAQLGPSLENGPFGTVLKQATSMIAIFTPDADIYLRMWCVFEIFIAVKLGVKIKFAAFNQQVRSGIENIYDAIYEHGQFRCNSIEARCGNAADETQIRSLISSTDGKFDLLDSVVEWCKANYHIGEVHHPGPVFNSQPAHLLLLGGSRKLDYLAKTLASTALAIERIPKKTIIDPNISQTQVHAQDDNNPELKFEGNKVVRDSSRICKCLIS